MEQPVQSQTQEKIKIVFEVSGIGVFSDREPLTGDINPCTAEDKERMATVLTWEGSKAKIQIQNENGVAIDVKTIKPLSHFDPNVEYYYIDGAFVPTDINGLQTFVTYLNGNIKGTVTSEQQTYMKVIHDVVDKILNLPARPSEAISEKIFDRKEVIKESHDAFYSMGSNYYTDQTKCNTYLTALQNVLNPSAPVNPPGGGDTGGDLNPVQPQPQTQAQDQAQAQTQAQLQPQAQTQAQTQAQPQAQTQSQTQAQPQAQTQAQPQPQAQAQTQAQTQAQPQAQTQTQRSRNKKEMSKTGSSMDKTASYGTIGPPGRKPSIIPSSGPGVRTGKSNVSSSSFIGGNRTRRHQHKKNRQTRRYNFQ